MHRDVQVAEQWVSIRLHNDADGHIGCSQVRHIARQLRQLGFDVHHLDEDETALALYCAASWKSRSGQKHKFTCLRVGRGHINEHGEWWYAD